MAKQITCSLVLLVLTIAAASIPAPTDAAGFMEIFEKYLKEPLGKATDILEAIDKATDGGLLRRRGNNAAARLPPAADAITAVQAGGMNFPVAGVDVTSTVTWTSRCGGGGGGRAVPCGHRLCEQHGKFALLGTEGKEIFSRDNASYACRPNAGGDDYAVLGLGRGDTTSSFHIFSYILDGNLQGSTVWVSKHATFAEKQAAARAGGTTATTILKQYTAGSRSSFYDVGIAGIKVGSGEVAAGKEVAAFGILTTTIPFTILKPALFDHLEQELSAVVSPINGSDSDNGARFRQLCYPSGTELPAITLVFAGKDAAGMELRPEHYSYKKSSGVLCLSILRSPWAGSVIGSMVQAGRRMTYKLDDNTLTFDVTASSSASSETPTLSSSSSAAAQAKLTPFFMSHALVVLLLAIVMWS